MKKFKRTYHFDQDFFLDELDEQVTRDTEKSYEDGGQVDLPMSNSYQLILLRKEQIEMKKKQLEIEHQSSVIQKKLNVSLVVNLVCFLFLVVMFMMSIQKILQILQELRFLLG